MNPSFGMTKKILIDTFLQHAADITYLLVLTLPLSPVNSVHHCLQQWHPQLLI